MGESKPTTPFGCMKIYCCHATGVVNPQVSHYGEFYGSVYYSSIQVQSRLCKVIAPAEKENTFDCTLLLSHGNRDTHEYLTRGLFDASCMFYPDVDGQPSISETLWHLFDSHI